ncbi:hypothetical protein G6F70_001230 [Rhizopus microsporus]|nr:hypothetical protein G6F71_002182 [Rhizopus microsporus]KAG1203640.1 hypothetical protein G6F70_001230 [Rhizopus microsporus]KAG1208570.1 hypothetical protein G6F69_007105 [Rhizopus microsporus]KAG1229927.1 hypothetical protein G6F67_006812 [Rhizopus microsporus]KAG1261942.1 hypothetical protein G6F68_006313 [Rhizopus microsporus]
MGQNQSRQDIRKNVKEEDVSELVRCSSDLSISDKSYSSKDKAKKKKSIDSHRGVLHGGIKKKRIHKSGNPDIIRHNATSGSSSSSAISIRSSSSSLFNTDQNEELSIYSSSVEESYFERPKRSVKKLDWESHSDAWAFLHSLNPLTCKSEYLRYQYDTNERPGYLIGTSEACNIRINDEEVQDQHCLIYPEVYVDINNNSRLQVRLRDMRRESTIPIQVNGTNFKPEYTRGSYCLHPNDVIRISNNTLFRIIFAPSKAKIPTFQDDYKLGPVIGMSLYSKIIVANLRKNKDIQHAVKMIRKDSFTSRPETLKQFMQEVAILMSLEKHVSIIKVYDEAEYFHLVMEYFPEGDLYSLIVNSKCLSEEHTRTIFRQLLSAVNFLHQAGVVHRDIKPENILMVSKANLQVKICDFGLAALHKRNLLHSYCGSPSYDDEYTSIEQKILSGSLDHSEQLPVWNSLSHTVKHLIKRLLKVKPEERPTAAEALNDPWFNIEPIDNE